MKNIEMLTILQDIAKNGVNTNNEVGLNYIITILQDKVNKENAKENGSTNILKVAKQIIKSCEKIQPKRKDMIGMIDHSNNFTVPEGCEIFTNGHVILKSYKKTGLYKADDGCLNFNSFFVTDDKEYKIELPSATYLKNEIARVKASTTKVKAIMFKIGCYYFDASYLLMGIEATGAKYALCSKNPNSKGYAVNLIYMKSDDAEFVVLPIKPTENILEVAENNKAIAYR